MFDWVTDRPSKISKFETVAKVEQINVTVTTRIVPW